jgi:hypothetical protein
VLLPQLHCNFDKNGLTSTVAVSLPSGSCDDANSVLLDFAKNGSFLSVYGQPHPRGFDLYCFPFLRGQM